MSGIKHNRLITPGFKPKADEIERDELVINEADKTLWTKDQNDIVISIGGANGVDGINGYVYQGNDTVANILAKTPTIQNEAWQATDTGTLGGLPVNVGDMLVAVDLKGVTSSDMWSNLGNIWAQSLDELSNVTIIDPIEGQALTYDENNNVWINGVVAGAGGTGELEGGGADTDYAPTDIILESGDSTTIY